MRISVMEHQAKLLALEFTGKRKQTRREKFLSSMEEGRSLA